jgi:hypothetical protein
MLLVSLVWEHNYSNPAVCEQSVYKFLLTWDAQSNIPPHTHTHTHTSQCAEWHGWCTIIVQTKTLTTRYIFCIEKMSLPFNTKCFPDAVVVSGWQSKFFFCVCQPCVACICYELCIVTSAVQSAHFIPSHHVISYTCVGGNFSVLKRIVVTQRK